MPQACDSKIAEGIPLYLKDSSSCDAGFYSCRRKPLQNLPLPLNWLPLQSLLSDTDDFCAADILGDLPTALDSECNSPLKLLQIGGDDLQMFDRDDPSENADYLLTDDVAQAFN